MDRYKFGEFIYQKRKALGLTQDELGRKLGVTNKAVSKWEVGETTPEVTMLEPLASILNVSVDELLTQKEKNKEEKKIATINKTFLILTILLLIINVLMIISFTIYINNQNTKEDPIIINEDNFNNIIEIDEMTNFECLGQSIIISSKYELNNNYYIKDNESVTFNIEFVIEYYYYLENGEMGVISYYERVEEVVFNNSSLFINKQLTFSPKTEINNFKSFKNVIVKYTVLNYEGTVYKQK